jgi:hypothetical protein
VLLCVTLVWSGTCLGRNGLPAGVSGRVLRKGKGDLHSSCSNGLQFREIPCGAKTANRRATAEATYITVGLFVILPTLRSRAIRLLQVTVCVPIANMRPCLQINVKDAAQNLVLPSRRGTSGKIRFTGEGSFKTHKRCPNKVTVPTVPTVPTVHVPRSTLKVATQHRHSMLRTAPAHASHCCSLTLPLPHSAATSQRCCLAVTMPHSDVASHCCCVAMLLLQSATGSQSCHSDHSAHCAH